MKKIALILTGGTIGSAVEDHVISTGETSVYRLVEAFGNAGGDEERFEVFSPFQELSENFNKKHWQQLYDFLYAFSFEAYQGVIIAHGTDTLAYTSALVGMLFSHVQIPVIFIASNYAIGEVGSNGLVNLQAAVAFVEKQIAPGVFVAYENQYEQVEIHLATRLLPADNYCDQYGSFGGVCFGIMKKSKEEGFSFVKQEGAHQPTLQQLKEVKEPILKKKINFQKEVLFLMPYPGQNYERYVLSDDIGAVYQYLYHAGTVCVTEEPYNFLTFAQKCSEQEIPVFMASLKAKGKDQYATQKSMEDQKIYPMFDISPVAGYMKLIIAVNQNEYALEEYVKKNVSYEQVTEQN